MTAQVHSASVGPEPINRDLADQAIRFSRAFLHWIDGDPDALPYPRLRVLEMLHCQGPAKMKSLADDLGMSARKFTTLADALEGDGLVRRTPHPTDRRATLLELTPTGRSAAECSLAPRMEAIGQLFEALSPTDRVRLQRSLRALTEVIDPSQCPGP